ncbi:hypothetical protein K458DRAFT_393574 [Lentithecium fluviatile CBS 122367]|uniref:Uncharacterized protein n=1 Tax=Lentithecium fluviatile CBS 122367 TaxID=1168545 RepID=A0A6G1IPC7_9PLEO|nr:hypothetical protein K458DRAFT_393574 [Lentithecium fluviatile CBS 122367]
MSTSPGPESSGNESAEQQLFAESQPSASKPRQPPSNAAIRSAHLLNAARVDKLRVASDPSSSAPSHILQTHDPVNSSANMAGQKGGAGKLKRPSFLHEDMAKNPRRNLARRGDPFDLNVESPEKKTGSPFKLPQTVNRSKPLKRVNKGKAADIQPDQRDAAISPSSAPSGQPVPTADEDQLPVAETKALRLSSPPPKRTRSKREAEDHPPIPERQSKSPQREISGMPDQSAAKAPVVKPKARTRMRRKHPKVMIPAPKAAFARTRAGARAEAPHTASERPVRVASPAADEVVLSEFDGDGDLLEGGEDDDAVPQDDPQEAAVEAEESGADEPEAEEWHSDREQSALERVFAFTQLEKRHGKCRTEQAAYIKRTCRVAALSLTQPNTTASAVLEFVEEIQAMLLDFGAESEAEERTQLKVDAYGYLFRELVAYLVALHGWLERTYGEVADSLDAMRVLFAFAKGIVLFKDTIAAWKVSLSTRYKNDHLVKDVDTKLITPLRRVVETYRVTLSLLEAAARARRIHDEQRRKRDELLEEQRRRETNVYAQKERWKRWQDLHVWRQQCEPDPLRRRNLYIDQALFAKRLPYSDERDANGLKFERVPLFKERDSPMRPDSSGAEEGWIDEEYETLIEGLQEFAGPDVFRKIFKQHCRPGGALRDFNVAEITAQAANIRSTLIAQYQSEGWVVDDWIKQIPILP